MTVKLGAAYSKLVLVKAAHVEIAHGWLAIGIFGSLRQLVENASKVTVA